MTPCQNNNLTNDSYPYVTGMGFRRHSHLIWDEFQTDDPSAITANGQVVFVKTDFIDKFFKYAMPKIKHQINIITHNSALGIDLSHLQYLNHIKVLNWYAQNANIVHPKLTSIPLGIANGRWPHGDTKKIEAVINEPIEKEHLVYMNFEISTNVKERTDVYNLFRDKEYVNFCKKKPFTDYLRDLKSSKFALSPEGRGADCHRVWESILLGTIPIVKRCNNISFYEDMPILIVDDWTSVSKTSLTKHYEDFILNKRPVSKIYLDYWIKRIGLKKHE